MMQLTENVALRAPVTTVNCVIEVSEESGPRRTATNPNWPMGASRPSCQSGLWVIEAHGEESSRHLGFSRGCSAEILSVPSGPSHGC